MSNKRKYHPMWLVKADNVVKVVVSPYGWEKLRFPSMGTQVEYSFDTPCLNWDYAPWDDFFETKKEALLKVHRNTRDKIAQTKNFIDKGIDTICGYTVTLKELEKQIQEA